MFRSLTLAFFGSMTLLGFGQCANDNVLTGAAVTPPCPGSTAIPCVQGGQYVLVNVVAGNTYTFNTCGAGFDTQITLFNNTGGGSLGYNDDGCGLQSTVTWTATFTGQLRVLVDQFTCANNTICSPLGISCTAPPVGDCVYVLTLNDLFADGWGTSFVGVSINGGPFQNYTVSGATNQVLIGVNIGDIVVLNYNNSGAFQTDNSYTLQLGGSGLFNSGTPPVAGLVYTGVVSCVPPPPPQEDCLGAATICSNLALSNNTTNTGNVADINAINSGCLDIIENQGTWYIFSPSVGGNLGFTINPLGPDDYDWAIWGPFPSGTQPGAICPPSGPPIRCAASSGPATFGSTGSYGTGMGHATFSPPQFASTAVSYGIPSTLDICPLVPPQYCGWVPGMQVVVGQVYLMYISNWSLSSTGFNLNWNLQNGASLDCTILPMELIDFQAIAIDAGADLRWSTASEVNSDHFGIERSTDGEHFEEIGTLPGAGSSMQPHQYTFLDRAPHPGLNFYRLRQVDVNGEHDYSPLRSVLFKHPGEDVRLVPNPGSGLVDVYLPIVDPGSTLQMLDAVGREVMRLALTSDRATIDAATLPHGFYGFRVLSPSGRTTAHGTWIRE
ncbi:MAG: hypothetical protein ABI432_05355 [Flavobacteriales bacterium]